MRTVLAMVLITCASFAQRAEACSGCGGPFFAPKQPLPSNVLSIPSHGETYLFGPDGLPVVLEGALEGVKPHVTPMEGVVYKYQTGTVTIACFGPAMVDLTFGPAAAFPKAGGTLTVAPRTGSFDVFTTSGACVDKINGSGVGITLNPDPALVPYLELSKEVLFVDGQPWPYSSYAFGDHHAYQVFGACGDSPAGADRGLTEGEHHGELRVHIAGMVGDLPGLPFDVNVECPRSGGCGASPGTLAAALAAFALSRLRRASRPSE